jgi:hypothetical protein
MMRNGSFLCKRQLCVIVRRCVYSVNFSALQTKHLFLSKDGQPRSEPASTHSRTIRMIHPVRFD